MAHPPPPTNFPPPQPFLLQILPLLLSPFPSPLPPLLLSNPARQAIHYLGLRPEDDAYWTAGTRNEAVVARRRELVEAGDIDDLVLGDPHYSFDLEETKCIIPLSLPYSAAPSESLGVVLLWEDALPQLAAAEAAADAREKEVEEDDTRPGWVFLELQALSQPPGEMTVSGPGGRRRPSWYPSLGEAVDAAANFLATTLDPPSCARRDSPPELLEFQRESPLLGSKASPPQMAPVEPPFALPSDPRAAPEGPEPAAAKAKKKKKTVAEMEDGNGAATPGAYGTADDFWDGWSEDEDEDEGERPGPATPAEEDEDDYWNSYGAGSQVGDEPESPFHKQELAMAASTHLATVPHLASPPQTPPEPVASDPALLKPVTRDRSSTITPATASSAASPASSPRPSLAPPAASAPFPIRTSSAEANGAPLSRGISHSPTQSTAPAVPPKSLPPAPSQITLVPSASAAFLTSPSQPLPQLGSPALPSSRKDCKGRPPSLSPSRGLFSGFTAGGKGPASPRSPKSPRSPGLAPRAPDKPTPPLPGSTQFPLSSPTAAPPASPSAYPFPASAASPAPPAPVASPLPRPSFAPPALPSALGTDRLGSGDSATTAGASVLHSTSIDDSGVTEEEARHARELGSGLLSPSSNAVGEERAGREGSGLAEGDDALVTAFSGMWALFAAGTATGAEKEERRRRFLRAAEQAAC
ncbi:hypothetical protein JCM10213_002120 [Rhodosporidiobolus nylandii]